MMIEPASDNTNRRFNDRYRPDYSFLIGISATIVALDCATKSWATRHLSGLFDGMNPSGPVTLALQENRAGAFGLMTGAKPAFTRILFSTLSLVSVVAVVWLYLRLKSQRSGFKWGVSLVLGGALGNLLDRIRFGYVVDFVDVHVLFLGVQRRMSRFNLADVAISVGVGLMAAEILRRRRASHEADQAASHPVWPSPPS